VGVVRICSLLGLAKGTYYDATHPHDRLKEKYASLRTHIDNIIRKHSAYGVRRIKAELAHRGITIGRDTLGILLKLWGLSLKRKVKPRTRSVVERILGLLKDRCNILARMSITRPLQAITSDMTELWYAHGTQKCYLCVHKDVFGQVVYGWSIDKHMEVGLVLSSFKQAIAYLKKKVREIPEGLVFHQDRGSQYTAYAYVDAVLSFGTLSYSSPGTPTDNPGQESFFGRFKDEWRAEIAELKNIKEVERFVKQKLTYYNTQRLHTSIDYRTPLAFTKTFLTNWGKQFSESRT
jgi:putative transposase